VYQQPLHWVFFSLLPLNSRILDGILLHDVSVTISRPGCSLRLTRGYCETGTSSYSVLRHGPGVLQYAGSCGFQSPLLPARSKTSPPTSCHVGLCGPCPYGRSRPRPMPARQTPRLPQNPRTQSGPRAKKISGRYGRLPCTPRGPGKSQSWGARHSHAQVWPEPATSCNFVWLRPKSVVHWWCKFGAIRGQMPSKTATALLGTRKAGKR
jgi:hypothetical protein